jgi:uncharacterized protein YecT (DUF1311 family)
MLFKALPVMLALFAVPAFAAPPVIKPPVKLPAADPCPKAMNGKDRAVCLAPVLEAATQSLEATSAQIKAHFKAGAPYVALFDASHDAWVKEVAQTCHAAEQFYDGGDISYAIGLDCQIQMTRDREKLLKTLYNAPLNH